MKQVYDKYLRNSPLPLVACFLCLFFLLRIGFLLTNLQAFSDSETSNNQYISAFIFGSRLDLIATFYWLIFPLLLLPIVVNKRVRLVIISFVTIVPLIISAVDAAYFKYSKERLGLDFWHFLDADNNISIFVYLKEFWLWLVVIFVGGFFLIKVLEKIAPKQFTWKQFGINFLTLILLFLILRGGFRSRPFRSADAAQNVIEQLIPLSFNPMLIMFETWINSDKNEHLDALKALPPDVLLPNKAPLKPLNIVIIILESFGKEYTSLNHNYAVNYTPHLNKLMEKSLVFTDAYANGLKSMDAVPAIFCSLPRLEKTPLINSPLSTKRTSSFIYALGELGYNSSFFHGADNLSMGFRSFLTAQGLDQYYGIEEYTGDKEDNDGHWGIYDLPYFQYVAKTLNTKKEPFLAGVFTLSSHHPYVVPEKYSTKFPAGNLQIHQSIGYADFALDSFFSTCKSMPWFDNTLFIITADHSSENALHAYRTPSGKYEIPLLIYAPKHIKPQIISKTVSQIDIAPTILDLINYPEKFSTLGKSAFDAATGKVCHFDNNQFHITSNGWNLGLSNGHLLYLYNKSVDPNCLDNVLTQYPDTANVLKIKLEEFGSKYKGMLR